MTVTCKRHKSQVIIYSCCPRHLSPKDADIQDSRSTQGKRPRIVPVETPVLKHGTALHSPWHRALKTLPKMQPWKSIPTSPFTIKVTTQDWWILLVQAPEESSGALSVPVSDCIKVIMILFLNSHFQPNPKSCLFQASAFLCGKGISDENSYQKVVSNKCHYLTTIRSSLANNDYFKKKLFWLF